VQCQVRTVTPTEDELARTEGGEEGQVCSLVASEAIAVCGLHNGTANVYRQGEARLARVLDCHSLGGSVQLALGAGFLVAASSHGIVSVWETKSWALLCTDDSHMGSELAVAAAGPAFLTGDGAGAVREWGVRGGAVTQACVAVDTKHPVHCIDYDGTWALAGSRNSLQVWRVLDRSRTLRTLRTGLLASCCLVSALSKGTCLARDPLAVTTGHGVVLGVRLWHLGSGQLLRTLLPRAALAAASLREGLLAVGSSAEHSPQPGAWLLDLEAAVAGVEGTKEEEEEDCVIRRLECGGRGTVRSPAVAVAGSRSGRRHRGTTEQCSVVQCSAVQCSAVQCSAVQCPGSWWRTGTQSAGGTSGDSR
jgi:hypothetical protein